MRKISTSLNKSFEKGQGKNTTLEIKEKAIFYYLQKEIPNATMISLATGITQKNICIAKQNLEKEVKLQELFRGFCKAIGFKTYYLTTNKAIFKNNDLKQ